MIMCYNHDSNNAKGVVNESRTTQRKAKRKKKA